MRHRLLLLLPLLPVLTLLFLTGCALSSSPLEIKVIDGERSESYRGTESVQYYKWWADIEVRNTMSEPLYFSLERVTYGKNRDVVQAGEATVGRTTYAQEEWASKDAEHGRSDERITVQPGQTLELSDVGFETHPEARNGKIRIAVDGQVASESEPVDFLSFRSRR